MHKAAEAFRPNESVIWQGLREGLCLSGLRLGEALELSWDVDAEICVDLTGKYPCLVIDAESEQGFRDRRLPITPDFSAVLTSTSVEGQRGTVFAVTRKLGLDRVSRVICKIGEKAIVIVNGGSSDAASAIPCASGARNGNTCDEKRESSGDATFSEDC